MGTSSTRVDYGQHFSPVNSATNPVTSRRMESINRSFPHSRLDPPVAISTVCSTGTRLSYHSTENGTGAGHLAALGPIRPFHSHAMDASFLQGGYGRLRRSTKWGVGSRYLPENPYQHRLVTRVLCSGLPPKQTAVAMSTVPKCFKKSLQAKISLIRMKLTFQISRTSVSRIFDIVYIFIDLLDSSSVRDFLAPGSPLLLVAKTSSSSSELLTVTHGGSSHLYRVGFKGEVV